MEIQVKFVALATIVGVIATGQVLTFVGIVVACTVINVTTIVLSVAAIIVNVYVPDGEVVKLSLETTGNAQNISPINQAESDSTNDVVAAKPATDRRNPVISSSLEVGGSPKQTTTSKPKRRKNKRRARKQSSSSEILPTMRSDFITSPSDFAPDTSSLGPDTTATSVDTDVEQLVAQPKTQSIASPTNPSSASSAQDLGTTDNYEKDTDGEEWKTVTAKVAKPHKSSGKANKKLKQDLAYKEEMFGVQGIRIGTSRARKQKEKKADSAGGDKKVNKDEKTKKIDTTEKPKGAYE